MENDLWLKNVKQDLKTYDLNEEMIKNESKDMIKKKINKKTEEIMITNIREEGKKKGKVKRYIEKCEREIKVTGIDPNHVTCD